MLSRKIFLKKSSEKLMSTSTVSLRTYPVTKILVFDNLSVLCFNFIWEKDIWTGTRLLLIDLSIALHMEAVFWENTYKPREEKNCQGR